MRLIILYSLFLISSFSVYGQTPEETYGVGFSVEANKEWLTILKHAYKNEQLIMIQDRFFKPKRPIFKGVNEDVPVMVVNGIPIHHEMHEGLRNFLASELRAVDVETEVLDKEKEGLLGKKRWTGLIIMNVINKKTLKRMYK